MGKEREPEIDRLRTEVFELRIQVKDMIDFMAEHIYGLRVGDMVYVCDGPRSGDRATVERMEPKCAQIRFPGEGLTHRIPYAQIQKSQLVAS